MKVQLEFTGGELRLAFTGAAECLPSGAVPEEEALRRLDEQVTVKRPSRVSFDFTGLTSVDGPTFRRIAEEVERLRGQVPIFLAGPGPGLERLFEDIPSPPGWSWEGEPLLREDLREGGGKGIFEIDLERELLLLQSEPAAPEYNPMAQPLQFLRKGEVQRLGWRIEREAEQGVEQEVKLEARQEAEQETEREVEQEVGQDEGILFKWDIPPEKSFFEWEQIPGILRGDIPRGRNIRAFDAVLQERRSGCALSRETVLQLAYTLTTSVRRSPFAVFDLDEARNAALAASAMSTTGMALCMALHARAPLRRLRSLALTGLLSVLLSPAEATLSQIPEDQGSLRSFAGRILRKLSDSHMKEMEVREDLKILSLVREYWKRIGPGPEGGMDPAQAAWALSRGEIGAKAPPRLRQLFLRTFSVLPPGSWVRLNSGEVGMVVLPGSRRIADPLVLSLFGGGGQELHFQSPRLVGTGQVRAVVECPVRRCPNPNSVLCVRVGDSGIVMERETFQRNTPVFEK